MKTKQKKQEMVDLVVQIDKEELRLTFPFFIFKIFLGDNMKMRKEFIIYFAITVVLLIFVLVYGSHVGRVRANINQTWALNNPRL